MNDNFKPDLGTHYSQIYNKEITHRFYSVPCHEIVYVAPELYSIMENIIIADKEYAVSFDFSYDTLLSLLSQINDKELFMYLSKTLTKKFKEPAKSIFHETPILLDIIAKLGEPVKSLYEEFTPFVVDEFLISTNPEP